MRALLILGLMLSAGACGPSPIEKRQTLAEQDVAFLKSELKAARAEIAALKARPLAGPPAAKVARREERQIRHLPR